MPESAMSTNSIKLAMVIDQANVNVFYHSTPFDLSADRESNGRDGRLNEASSDWWTLILPYQPCVADTIHSGIQ
jgi:hypothetical protein